MTGEGEISEGSHDPWMSRDLCHRDAIEECLEQLPGHVTTGLEWGSGQEVSRDLGGGQRSHVTHEHHVVLPLRVTSRNGDWSCSLGHVTLVWGQGCHVTREGEGA